MVKDSLEDIVRKQIKLADQRRKLRYQEEINHRSVLRQLTRSWAESMPNLAPYDPKALEAHVAGRLEAATVVQEPIAHIVVDDFLPRDFYDDLRTALPPDPYFQMKRPQRIDLVVGPDCCGEMFGFFPLLPEAVQDRLLLVDGLFKRIVAPAIGRKLEREIAQSLAESFGELAPSDPELTMLDTRIMRRRPGYELRPHLDPRRALGTGLLYLAEEDEERPCGTQLFRTLTPLKDRVVNTDFVDDANLSPPSEVAYRANRFVLFAGSLQAVHAIRIDPAVFPENFVRNTLQAYVALMPWDQSALIDRMPKAQRAQWLKTSYG